MEGPGKIKHSRPVPPFLRWCSATIPAVFDDSLTYYEALCSLWKWLQTNLVEVVNNNATVTQEYIRMVDELKEFVENYFENLDVQEEINNKLDEMAEDGTLQEIIGAYLESNVAWTFDSVESMKEATNLVNGSFAQTTGYYASGDGGAGYYYITTADSTDDGGSVITLDNGLQAKLVVKNNIINVKQFGAKGDGSTDDTTAVQNALAYNTNNPTIVNFVKGETYILDGDIYIYSNTTIDLNSATIKTADGTPPNTGRNKLQFMNNLPSMEIAGYGAIKNFNVKNGTFDGNLGGVSFLLFHGEDCTFENLQMLNAFVSTHVFDLGGCKNIKVKDCNFIGCLMSVADNAYREVIQPDYASAEAVPYWGDDPSFAFDDLPTDGLLVDGCVFKKNPYNTYYLNGVGTHSARAEAHTNIVVKNCEFYDCEHSDIRLPKANYVTIENNKFYNLRTNRTGDYFAINIYNESGGSPLALHDIVIKGNEFISGNSTNDQIFIRVAGSSAHITSKVVIEDNIYNGTAVSEAANSGKDFAHLKGVNGVVCSGNIINNAKAIIFTGSEIANNIKFINNTCNNCLRGARSNASAADPTSNAYPEGFIWANNIWTNPIGAIDTSGASWTLKLSDDVTYSDDNATFHRLPVSIANGTDLYIDSNNYVLVPSYVKRFRVSGTISITTASGGTINYTESGVYSRIDHLTRDNKNQVNGDTAGIAKNFAVGDFTEVDNSLVWDYFSSDEERLWREGYARVYVGIRSQGNVTVNAADTRITIEAF